MASKAVTTWTNFVEQVSPALSSLIRNLTNSLADGKALIQTEPQSSIDRLLCLLTDYAAVSYTTFAATVLGLIYFLFSMSSTRRGHSPYAGRRSPYTASTSGPIRDLDFEYVEPDRRTTPIHRDELRYAEPESRRRIMDDENAPDVIIIRHLNTNYPLRFKAYAISDGLLTVGDVRYFAAETLGIKDPSTLRLLYKGHHLKDDSKMAKAEGLKQHSEVVVVVSEVPAQGSGVPSSSDDEDRDSAVGTDTSKRRRRTKKSRPPQPTQPPRDSVSPTANGSGASGSSAPSGSPQDLSTPRGKVENLVSIYTTQWRPLCEQYLSHPPPDSKTREFEHKRLTESVLQHIIMKADDIDMEGDQQARQERKVLLNEAQEILKRLDAVAGTRS